MRFKFSIVFISKNPRTFGLNIRNRFRNRFRNQCRNQCRKKLCGIICGIVCGKATKKIKQKINEMTTQNSHQKDDFENVKILTDIALWKLLTEDIKKTHKLSRVQAFFNLIDIQCIATLKGGDAHIAGSIMQFAKAWGWDRKTVGRFLDNLQQLGVLTIITDGKRKTLRLQCMGHREAVPRDTHEPSEAKTPSLPSNGT